MPEVGFEPTTLAGHGPEPCAYTKFRHSGLILNVMKNQGSRSRRGSYFLPLLIYHFSIVLKWSAKFMPNPISTPLIFLEII